MILVCCLSILTNAILIKNTWYKLRRCALILNFCLFLQGLSTTDIEVRARPAPYSMPCVNLFNMKPQNNIWRHSQICTRFSRCALYWKRLSARLCCSIYRTYQPISALLWYFNFTQLNLGTSLMWRSLASRMTCEQIWYCILGPGNWVSCACC